MDIVVKADYSDKPKDNHSYFQVWFNGDLVCDIKDTIVNKLHMVRLISCKRINFRYGIYNNKVDRVAFMPTRTVWYDEMRIGLVVSLEEVQLVTENPVD